MAAPPVSGIKGPVRSDHFHHHTNFNNALTHLARSNILVLAGPSGAGKSQLAAQLWKRFKREHGNNLLSGNFPSDNWTDRTSPAIERFMRQKDIPLYPFLHDEVERVIPALYSGLNQVYPQRCKLLMFDDAEMSTYLLYHIDQNILAPLEHLEPDDPLRMSWKIIITTQSAANCWVRECDYVTEADFLEVLGFSEDEMAEFFSRGAKAQNLTPEELNLIKRELGTRPLMLQVLLKEIENGESTSGTLRSFVAGIDGYGRVNNKDVHALFRSLERLVQQADRGEEYKRFIMLLTMFNETDFTFEFLTSCAEVTLAGENNNQQNFSRRSSMLRVDFIRDMRNHFLCSEPEQVNEATLISFHKLIMQSMRQFRCIEPSIPRDVDLARKAVIALTRVIPRDGRCHQSHVIYDYMYNHACSLVQEVEILRYHDKIDRVNTPCIMLWMSKLQMSMAYCQHSMRLSVKRAKHHIQEALDWFSLLTTNKRYDELGSPDTAVSANMQKAVTLFGEITGSQSTLNGNRDYELLVEQVPQFLHLTTRDMKIMFERDVDDSQVLFNGHLDDMQMRELLFHKKALSAAKLAKIFPVELLAEIYHTAAKAMGFHRDPQLTDECMDYAKAALYLYGKIKTEYDIDLMAKVITTRDRLNIRLEAENLVTEELDEIIAGWQGLVATDCKVFEYGLMRADFGNDPYNDFLCKEGLAVSEGRKCAISRYPDEIARVRRRFHDLAVMTECSKASDRKLQMNYQTASKVHRKYGEFLWRCELWSDAVKAIIEAFIRLNYFLCRDHTMATFPELEETCGKAKSLLKVLRQYFHSYEQHPSDEGLLQHDGIDQLKLRYVMAVVVAWRECDRKPESFDVMEKILETSHVYLDDIYGDPEGQVYMQVDEVYE